MSDYFSSMNVDTTIVDKSIVNIEDTLTLSLLPIVVGGFSSKGIYHKTVQLNDPNVVSNVFGDDFEDLEKYGQQNLNFMQQLRGGGSGFFVRLIHEDSAKKANRLISLKMKKVDEILLYERDGYGAFKLDENGDKIPLTYMKKSEQPDQPAVSTQVKVPGIQCSILLSSVENEEDPSSNISTEDDGKTITVPLIFNQSNTKGSCGNNFGINIDNDPQRDEMVSDGRRYILKTYELKTSGYQAGTSDYFFSFNPEAIQSEINTESESLDSVYSNLDSNNNSTDIQLNYFGANYKYITEFLKSGIEAYNTFVAEKSETDKELYDVLVKRSDYNPDNAIDIDFINLKTIEQLNYDYLVPGEDHNSLSVGVTSMENGNDGWLSETNTIVINPYVIENPTRGATEDQAIELKAKDVTDKTDSTNWKYGKVTVDFRKAVMKQLLITFYNCDIVSLRKEILSIYKCPCGYIADANYDMDIKKAMIEFAKLRKDVAVIFDGTMSCTNLDQAINIAKTLRALVGEDNNPERFTFVPHIGTTTNTTKKNRVTATYEFCYDIAKVYSLAPFAIIAGYQNQYGAVRTMKLDWVVEEDKPRGSQFKKAKDNGIMYAVDLGVAASSVPDDSTTKEKNYWMSNRSFYPKTNSKFSEFRNGVILADLRRIASIVLARYTYDTETAENNMAKSKKDLDKQIEKRYSKDLIITTTFFQTAHDKLVNNCSVSIEVAFPDIIERYTVTISGGRQS